MLTKKYSIIIIGPKFTRIFTSKKYRSSSGVVYIIIVGILGYKQPSTASAHPQSQPSDFTLTNMFIISELI